MNVFLKPEPRQAGVSFDAERPRQRKKFPSGRDAVLSPTRSGQQAAQARDFRRQHCTRVGRIQTQQIANPIKGSGRMRLRNRIHEGAQGGKIVQLQCGGRPAQHPYTTRLDFLLDNEASVGDHLRHGSWHGLGRDTDAGGLDLKMRTRHRQALGMKDRQRGLRQWCW